MPDMPDLIQTLKQLTDKLLSLCDEKEDLIQKLLEENEQLKVELKYYKNLKTV